jgi:hypothetical protein
MSVNFLFPVTLSILAHFVKVHSSVVLLQLFVVLLLALFIGAIFCWFLFLFGWVGLVEHFVFLGLLRKRWRVEWEWVGLLVELQAAAAVDVDLVTVLVDRVCTWPHQ